MRDGQYLAKPQIFGPERHPVFARYAYNFGYNIVFNAPGVFNITFAETNPLITPSNWRLNTANDGSLVWYTMLAERFYIPIIETVNAGLTTTLYIRILDTETRWIFNNPDLRIDYTLDDENTTDIMSLFVTTPDFIMRWNIIFSDPFGESDLFFDE